MRRNIEAFGGDPGNVTIFGESAGAGGVSLIPLVDGTQGLFRRVIAEAGAPSLTYSRKECQNLTRLLLESSGCSTMDELMTPDEKTLMELNEGLNDSNNSPERDGVVLPYDLYGAWEDEALADIDIMVGTNSDECRCWIREMGYYAPVFPKDFVYKMAVPFIYENNLKVMSEDEKGLAEEFMAMQSGDRIWRLTEFFNELLFRVPAVEQAIRHKGASYNYLWTMPGADEMLGACHAMELAYVFRNPQDEFYTGGLYNEELADVVQDMWVNFARSGNPSTEQYAWEPYEAGSRKTMVLGEEIGMAEDLKSEQRVLIEPLLHHYFNGCYSQLDYNVPQFYRIMAQLAATLAIIVGAIVIVIRVVRKKRERSAR